MNETRTSRAQKLPLIQTKPRYIPTSTRKRKQMSKFRQSMVVSGQTSPGVSGMHLQLLKGTSALNQSALKPGISIDEKSHSVHRFKPKSSFGSMSLIDDNMLSPAIYPPSHKRHRSSFSNNVKSQFGSKRGNIANLDKIKGSEFYLDQPVVSNYKPRELINKINHFNDRGQRIEIDGIGINSCRYTQLKNEEDKIKQVLRHSSANQRIEMQMKLQKVLLQGHQIEYGLFNQLDQELEKAQVDEMIGLEQDEAQKQESNQKVKNILVKISKLNKANLEMQLLKPSAPMSKRTAKKRSVDSILNNEF